MSIFGARVPITTVIGYQVAVMPSAGWKRLSELVSIPPDSTGALIYAIGADIPWMQAPDAIPALPSGLKLASGNYLTLDDSTQIRQLCLNTNAGGSFAIQFFTGPIGKLPKITAPNGGGGGGGGVQSVTGWQVDNTDPDNPVMIDPGPPVIPEIRSTVAIWVNQGVSPNGPPTPYDMGRSFPSINAALASYDYNRGDILVLLPGVHSITPGTLLDNVRIHFMDSQIVSGGYWGIKSDAIIHFTGNGAIYQLRDVLGTIHSNGVNIVSDIIMPSGNLYLKGNFGTPDQPCVILSYSIGEIVIHGELHGGLIIGYTKVDVHGDVHTYIYHSIELDECNASFHGNIIDHNIDANDRVVRVGEGCVISVRDIVTSGANTACIMAVAARQSIIEINGHLITPFNYAIIEAGGGDFIYNIRSSSVINSRLGVIDGTNASSSSVMNIYGAYSNRPIIFPGTVNGTLNVHPWVY